MTDALNKFEGGVGQGQVRTWQSVTSRGGEIKSGIKSGS